MVLAGVGVDILEIARMERALKRTPHMKTRLFTKEEQEYCDKSGWPAEHYAARFCAREAVLKALSTGFSQGVGWQDVSVTRDESGRPRALLKGRAKEIAQEQGIQEVALSLSHTHELAIANVVCVSEEVRPKKKEASDPRRTLDKAFREARSVLDDLDNIEDEGATPEPLEGSDALTSEQKLLQNQGASGNPAGEGDEHRATSSKR